MKKVVCAVIAVAMVAVIALSLSGCSSHECSVCGETKNVHKNRVTVKDLGGEDMANDEIVQQLREGMPYICDDCFDEMVKRYKERIIADALDQLGY